MGVNVAFLFLIKVKRLCFSFKNNMVFLDMVVMFMLCCQSEEA